MRNLHILLVGLILCSAALSQPLQLQLQLNPNPSPYLSDWQTRTETIFLSVNNPTTNTFQVKVDGRVFKGGPTGELQAQSKIPEMPPITIPPGPTILNAESVFPYDLVKFYGHVEQVATRAGRIPAGQYTLCVALVNAENPDQMLSQPRCSGFIIRHYLPPQLILPANNSVIGADLLRSTVFRWNRETPMLPEASAEFVVVEHRDGQPLWQALAANPPVYHGEVAPGLSQQQWPPDVVLPDNRQYVWSVRMLDEQGRPFTEPEWAEPFLFSISPGEGAFESCDCAGLTITPLMGQRTVGSADTDGTSSSQLGTRVGERSDRDGPSFDLVAELSAGESQSLAFKAQSNCPVECIRQISWTVHRLDSGGEKIKVYSSEYAEPFQSISPKDVLEFPVSEAGVYEIACRITIQPSDPTLWARYPQRVIQTTTAVKAVTGQTVAPPPPTKPTCELTLQTPNSPCTGSVTDYHTTPTIDLNFTVNGTFRDLFVVVLDNPCGTWIPPDGPVDRTPTTESPSDGYREITRLPLPTTSGTGTASVRIGDVVQPGAAYILRLTGVCLTENPDGTSTSTTTHAPDVCGRYRPLVDKTTSPDHSKSPDGTTSPRPSGETVPEPTPEVPRIPAEPIPCHPPRITDCGPSRTTDPATPIQATAELENPSDYPYPRAAPIRVNTLDWDYAIFHCSGCPDGTASEYRPVRDSIASITWKLRGKGSLNVPIDGNYIRALDDLLASQLKRLSEIKDSLALLEDEKKKAIDDFRLQKADAVKQIADRKKDQSSLQDSLQTIIKDLSKQRSRMDSLRQALDSIGTAFASLGKAITERQDSVARLDSLLTNPPSAAELARLAEVETTRQALESAQTTLQSLQTTIATTSASLQDAIKSADAALNAAHKAYSNAQNNAGKNTRSVAELQASQYKTPELKAYLTARRNLQRSTTGSPLMYMEIGGASVQALISDITVLLDLAHSALESTSPTVRAHAKKSVDSIIAKDKALLTSWCSSVADAATKATCSTAAADLSLRYSEFGSAFGWCITTGQKLTPGIEAKITAQRTALASKEAALAAAASAVEAAAKTHREALKAYETSIAALDASRKSTLEDIETKKTAHTDAQRKYQTESDKRDSIFTVLQPVFAEKRSQFAAERDSMRRIIDSLTTVVEQLRTDTTTVRRSVAELYADSTECEDSLNVLATEIARLSIIIAKTEADIEKPFNDAIVRLKSDSSDIERKIEQTKKDKETATQGKKDATGEFAYYIPPPLEEILSESAKQQFESLKDSVRRAEADVEVALSEKETLQATLARLLEGVANGLAEIKQLEKGLQDVDDELKAVNGDLADLKNELAKEFRVTTDSLNAVEQRSAAEAKNADDLYVKAVAEAKARITELESKESALNAAALSLESSRREVNAAVEAAASKRAAVQSSVNNLTLAANEQNQSRKELRNNNRSVKRATDNTRRAIAQENTAAEAAGKAAEGVARGKVTAKQAEINARNATIATFGATVAAEITALVKLDDDVAKAYANWAKAYDDHKQAKLAHHIAYSRYSAALQVAEKHRGTRDRADALAKRMRHEQEKMPKPNDVVDESSDVQSKEEAAKSLSESKKKFESAIETIKKSITNDVSKKNTLISEADKAISDARDKLKKAEEDLRSFIRSEFNKPEHADTLEFVVKDAVVDGFRSRDEEKRFICTINYNGTRIPKLGCEKFDPVKPPVKKIDGPCIPEIVALPEGGIAGSVPVIDKLEPRTIALIYKNGKPLWKEWPVFSDAGPIAKDVVILNAMASDVDKFEHACAPKVAGCVPPLPEKLPVVDLVSRDWIGKGKFKHLVARSPRVLWEPDYVSKALCREKQLTEAEYYANEIAADPKVKKESKPDVEPAVLVEVSDSLVGWPQHKDTVVARIVTGDHKGLSGERIIMIPRLKKGSSEGWKLDGAQTRIEVVTDGDGYAKAEFDFGKGFASWDVDVRWVRTDTCRKATVPVISPLHLRFHKFGKAAPTLAWDAAVKVWEGAGVDATLKSMTSVTDDEDPYGKMIHAIAGLMNENRGFVNDQNANFKPVRPRFTVKPEKEQTSLFGIARSQVQDTIEKKIITMKVMTDDTLKPVTRPQEIEKSYNPQGGKRFKIGDKNDLFFVEMDESFDLNDAVQGSGKIKIDSPNMFMRSLVDLPVTVSGVMLDADTVATEGTVEYTNSNLTAKWEAFTFVLKSIFIRAQIGCGITGSVSHEKLENPVEFTAELGGKGEFYGEVSNMPTMEFAGFKLRQGASIALDFHSKVPPESPLGPDFKGIVVGQAELEFPESFTAKQGGLPTVLSVTDFGLGSGGINGTIAISGGPLAMSFAKFTVSVSKVAITFEQSRITAGEIEGAFSLEKPFSGTLLTTISWGDGWKAAFSTKSSISIPRWKAVAAILPGTALEYSNSTGIGTFTLVAVIQSDQLGRIEINKLSYSSDGSFQVAGGVKKDVSIKVLKGFDLKITEVTIAATNDDFELQVHGNFGIPGIGLDQLAGILTVKPGPEIDVELTGGKISIAKGPFTLDGEFSWQDNSFYADLSVSIKNVIDKGLTGVIYVGTQPTSDEDSYTFWYVGLTIGTAIPLGQTGLAITSIGGGIGWNCRPPIGRERPTPENFNDIALRASVGIGNYVPPLPPGNIFNSEFVMVYAPGSITLGGSAWLMGQRRSIMGEGQLTLAWSPRASVSGFLRTLVGIPDEQGRVFLMRGKVDFLFNANTFKIESEYLDATLLGILNANAQFRVTKQSGFVKGKISYELSGSVPVLVGTVHGGLSLTTNGELTYQTEPTMSFTGTLSFSGKAYLSFEGYGTSWDLARAAIACIGTVTHSAGKTRLTGKASAYVTILGIGYSPEFDLGVEV